jgi:cysteine dioxygenase
VNPSPPFTRHSPLGGALTPARADLSGSRDGIPGIRLSTSESKSPAGPIKVEALRKLATQLDKHNAGIPLETLERYIQSVDLKLPEVFDLLQFDRTKYTRTQVYRSDSVEALLFVWLPGQQSSIHDHAGSACVVKVLSGRATETRFDVAGGRLHRDATSDFAEGSVTSSFDEDIHRVSNEDDAGRPLVTLHAYSPPLSTFRVYDDLPLAASA